MIIVGSGVDELPLYNPMNEVTIVEFMPNIVPLKTKTFRNKWSVLEKAGIKIMTTSSVEELTRRRK
jgi:NADH dehydrogenase FAD-containing subunit